MQWLSDRLAVYFGIGQYHFLSRLPWHFPASPIASRCFMPVQRKQVLRFLVTLPANDAVLHVVGTPAGELAIPEHDIPLRAPGRGESRPGGGKVA